MITSKQNQLYLRFPKIFRYRPMFGIECGNGWYYLIFRICEYLEAEAKMAGVDPESEDYPRVIQVKEKFGDLRFYYESKGLPGSVMDHVQELCSESSKICEKCGEPGKIIDLEGWYTTLCSKHEAEKIEEKRKYREERIKSTPAYGRPTLFLDFDGVLHPDAVFRTKHGLELRAPGELMMHAPVLEKILDEVDPVGEIAIVLSTSWVRELKSFDRTKLYLPHSLQKRVVGATWHKDMKRDNGGQDPFSWMTRYEQIKSHIKRNAITFWLAIDDLHSGEEEWESDDFQSRLIQPNSQTGLGDPEIQERLRDALIELIR